MLVLLYIQPGTPFTAILAGKAFPEPRLVAFGADYPEQCFAVAEKEVMVEINPPTIFNALSTLLQLYYILHIGYPCSKSTPAASILYFWQDMILEQPDTSIKKPSRYTSFVNSYM